MRLLEHITERELDQVLLFDECSYEAPTLMEIRSRGGLKRGPQVGDSFLYPRLGLRLSIASINADGDATFTITEDVF